VRSVAILGIRHEALSMNQVSLRVSGVGGRKKFTSERQPLIQIGIGRQETESAAIGDC
jgi:hypothetical protein